jgi:hypothetical protein
MKVRYSNLNYTILWISWAGVKQGVEAIGVEAIQIVIGVGVGVAAGH